mgnify:CR=1 FL=1|jgi:hypothetical protein
MDLLKLLESVGGKDSLGSLAGNLGLDSSKTSALVGALAPALMGALQKQTTSADGLAGLQNALKSGKHQQYLSKPELLSSVESVTDGNNILGHLLGGKTESRNVAAQAAETTGLDVNLIKKALPLVAGLAMGAVSKSSDSGNKLTDSIGDMFGSLMGGKLDMGDALGFAKKFF